MPEQYAIALGTFDGLHLGHMAVLQSICKQGVIPMALTFDLPPKFQKRNEQGLLITADEKHRLLAQMGIRPVVLEFEKVCDLSPHAFLEWVQKTFSPVLIASGFNFRFGKMATGDVRLLSSFCEQNDMTCVTTAPVLVGDAPVSSTRIRQAISDGAVREAADMLGRFFSYSAPVIHGDQRGRTIGFPTLNQAYPTELITPRFGVYASLTEIDGVRYRSVTNIGRRPTFATDYIISETYLFDYHGDAYGKNAVISLVGFVRDEMRFDGIDSLQKALQEDEKQALLHFKEF